MRTTRTAAFYRFRWFYDYSGGQLTNFGMHYLDVIHWALGRRCPEGSHGHWAASSPIDDNREVPDTMEVIWALPDGTLVTFSQFNANAAAGQSQACEIEFRGTKGTLYMHEGRGYEIVPENIRTQELPALSPINRKENAEQGRATKAGMRRRRWARRAHRTPHDHARDFLDCVKSRKECHCPVETGHRSTTATLLATNCDATQETADLGCEGGARDER